MATVYTRITNPFMPQGTPALTLALTPMYAPGELGCAFNDQTTGRTYLRVRVDPAATVLTGQLAFWKDRANFIVTNDKAQADVGTAGAINRVAGIFGVAVPSVSGNGTDGQTLYYIVDLIIVGQNVPVVANTALVGAYATVDTTGSTNRVLFTTGVSTAPVSQVVGIFRSTTITSTLGTLDINLGYAG
jgi:hypothetical protein